MKPIEDRLAEFIAGHLRGNSGENLYVSSEEYGTAQALVDGYVDFSDLSEAILNWLEAKW